MLLMHLAPLTGIETWISGNNASFCNQMHLAPLTGIETWYPEFQEQLHLRCISRPLRGLKHRNRDPTLLSKWCISRPLRGLKPKNSISTSFNIDASRAPYGDWNNTSWSPSVSYLMMHLTPFTAFNTETVALYAVVTKIKNSISPLHLVL